MTFVQLLAKARGEGFAESEGVALVVHKVTTLFLDSRTQIAVDGETVTAYAVTSNRGARLAQMLIEALGLQERYTATRSGIMDYQEGTYSCQIPKIEG
jgi:hypothetical protein